MDLYISSLLLGATGLTAMALSGLGSHGHSGGAHGHGQIGHGPTGQIGHGHGGHIGHGHPGHLPGAVSHAHGLQHAAARGQHAVTHATQNAASRALWAIASPRFLFSFALGFGATGLIFRQSLIGPLLVATAAAGAVVFERALVSPLWNFLMRFASKPAQTLETAVTDEATAVTTFDANGDGIVSVEVDGQVQQILATLRADDRRLGARVRAGQRVRIEDIDAERNRCTVSLL